LPLPESWRAPSSTQARIVIDIGSFPGQLFAALILVWAASELWLGWKRRSQDRSRRRDAGTLRLLLVTVYVCIGIAVWWSYLPAGHIGNAAIRLALFWTGLLLMATGLALRFWAIRVLARFFTVDVNIQEGHELIRRGPYRRLRHPSYTGSLMTFLGFGLALGNVWSLLVVMAPVTVAFIWRMRVEERVLAEAFPAQYPDYARQTKRLIPFVW
jgi:protein-S-isoprenylcysteine O-methyltransferase